MGSACGSTGREAQSPRHRLRRLRRERMHGRRDERRQYDMRRGDGARSPNSSRRSPKTRRRRRRVTFWTWPVAQPNLEEHAEHRALPYVAGPRRPGVCSPARPSIGRICSGTAGCSMGTSPVGRSFPISPARPRSRPRWPPFFWSRGAAAIAGPPADAGPPVATILCAPTACDSLQKHCSSCQVYPRTK